jgi:hypothetical protein
VGSSVDVERYFLIQPEGAFIACEGATLDDTELWAVAGAGIITGAGVVEGFDYAWRRIGPPA